MTDGAYKLPVPKGDFWVFGYGSLMWRPGFVYAETCKARLYGYHRHLCIWSWYYRGTQQRPGLVFGLMPGGSCVGRAFRVAAKRVARTVAYLYRREMIADVYHPSLRTVYLNDEHGVQSLVFLANHQHQQYAGKRPLTDITSIIAEAHGPQGSNYEYVMQTAGQLHTMGICDKSLQSVHRALLAHPPTTIQNHASQNK